jgi:hypothetical protein
MKVEKGEYCLRVNTRNVDINRNWDIFWQQGGNHTSEEFHGENAFSEHETTFIRDSIRDFKAKLFLSVHSGVYGLYLPYAYSDVEGLLILTLGSFNNDNMHKALELVKMKFCSTCQLGPPSRLIGYKSSGTCLDYIYDNFKVPYALAWEIYTNEVNMPELEFIRTSFKNLRGIESIQQFGNKTYDMEYIKQYDDDKNEKCLTMFNPVDKLSYDFIINNWTLVLYL